MKKNKHQYKRKALLNFHKGNMEFSTQEAVDFLNSYRSKYGAGIHRYTQTTHPQLSAILAGDANYKQTNPNTSKDTVTIWAYIGEEE